MSLLEPGYNPEVNKGKRLAIGMTIVVVLLLAAVFLNFNDKHVDVGLTAEDIIAAYDNNDESALKRYGAEIGLTLEEMKVFAADIKAEKEKIDRLKEREKTLGTWDNAVEAGTLVRTENQGGGERTHKYYDVTEDGLADFEIIYVAGEPKAWRYCDEEGKPYG